MPAKTKENPHGLTPMEERFVAEYLKMQNPSALGAAKAAKYKTAPNIATRIFNRTRVQDAIADGMKARRERLQLDADDVVRELMKVGFSNMLDYMHVDPETKLPSLDLAALTRDQAAAITEFGYDANGLPKIKLGSKLQALELLGKHLGAFIERHELRFPGDADDADLGEMSPADAAATWDQWTENA